MFLVKHFFLKSLTLLILLFGLCHKSFAFESSSENETDDILNSQLPMLINPLINQFANSSLENKLILDNQLTQIDAVHEFIKSTILID